MTGLRIFEKHPATDAYRFGPSYTPHAIVATEKRFSTAELFAQYWFCQNMGHSQIFTAQLYKFACRPHASDSDYQ